MTETERIWANIALSRTENLGQSSFLKAEYDAWRTSKKLAEMVEGSRYYAGDSDITRRVRQVIGENGIKTAIDNVPNNRCKSNFTKLLADQKTAYLLSKTPSIKSDDASVSELLEGYFDTKMWNLLRNAGTEAIIKGIAWLNVYYSDDGKLCLKLIPSEQVIPFWADDAHTELDGVLRVYETDVYENGTKQVLVRAEFYTLDGVRRFIQVGGEFLPDIEAGFESGHFRKGDTEMTWDIIPFIPIKYNQNEKTLTSSIKSLNDAYDKILSDMMNAIEEDPRSSILVLRNYDGQDLGEFRRNLCTYGAVKVCDDGGVETLSIKVDPAVYETAEKMLRAAIIKNGRGVDTMGQTVGNAPSGIAMRFIYSDLELDCNNFANEISASLDKLVWFIFSDIAIRTGKSLFGSRVEFIFNCDMLVNEKDIIDACKQSAGMISEKTIIANHPWVTDAEKEMTTKKSEISAGKDDESDGMA